MTKRNCGMKIFMVDLRPRLHIRNSKIYHTKWLSHLTDFVCMERWNFLFMRILKTHRTIVKNTECIPYHVCLKIHRCFSSTDKDTLGDYYLLTCCLFFSINIQWNAFDVKMKVDSSLQNKLPSEDYNVL